MFDSFSAGSVHYGRTLTIVGLVMALAILLHLI